jgi:hypothetical protein
MWVSPAGWPFPAERRSILMGTSVSTGIRRLYVPTVEVTRPRRSAFQAQALRAVDAMLAERGPRARSTRSAMPGAGLPGATKNATVT